MRAPLANEIYAVIKLSQPSTIGLFGSQMKHGLFQRKFRHKNNAVR